MICFINNDDDDMAKTPRRSHIFIKPRAFRSPRPPQTLRHRAYEVYAYLMHACCCCGDILLTIRARAHTLLCLSNAFNQDIIIHLSKWMT